MKRHKSFLFISLSLIIVLLAIFFLDFLTGFYKNTSLVRNEQAKFLMEVSPLITSTNHLLPNLSDEFINEQPSQKKIRRVNTNNFGLLIGPDTKEFGIPILFLGGSTTENNEVEEDLRFAYLAPKILSSNSSINFFGVNGGVRGHTTQDSTNLYLNHPSSLISSSHVVVVMHNINDRLRLKISNNYKSEINNPNSSSLEGINQHFLSLLSSSWSWLTSKSNILFLTDNLIDKFYESYKGTKVNEKLLDSLPPPDSEQVKKYKQNLKNLVSLIRINNQKPVLVTQPLGKKSISQDIFNNAIRDVSKELNVDLIDLAKELNNEKNPQRLFYDDYIHFNNFGSVWASEIIAKNLAHFLKLKKNIKRNCKQLNVNGNSIVDVDLNKDLLNGRYPSFNSYENKILFQTNKGIQTSISILDVISGKINTIIVSKGKDEVEHPTWITNNKVLYVAKNGNKRTLYVYDLLSNSNEALSFGDQISAAIPFVSENGDIYFSGYSDKNRLLTKPSIYAFRKSTNQLIKLTDNDAENWRPFVDKHEKVYFINNKSGIYQIYSKKPNQPQQLIVPSDNIQWDPALSADGKFLAYAEKNNQDFNIFIKNLLDTKSKPKKITHLINDEWDPRFSPTGDYLLYSGSTAFGDQIRAICLK